MDALSDNLIINALARCFNASGAKRWVIAYSGGLDSHVLLHACHLLRQHPELLIAPDSQSSTKSLVMPAQAGIQTSQEELFNIRAIHVNHHLQSSAEDFARHCQFVCDGLDIPLTVLEADSKPTSKDSIEAWARQTRYRLIEENLQEGELLLTAQTQDDQAETILLQLIRGAGIKGMAAMGQTKCLGANELHRPLLHSTRAQIESYAKQYGLEWIEDPTNQDTQFLRNFLRHDILPKLEAKVPGVKRSLARSAQHAGEADGLLSDLADLDSHGALCDVTGSLNQSKLVHLDKSRLKNVLRQWVQNKGHPLLSSAKLATVLEQMQAKHDSQPHIRWQQSSLRRFKQSWYLTKESTHQHAQDYEMTWDGQTQLNLPTGRSLSFKKTIGAGLKLAEGAKLVIKTRSGAQRLKPVNAPHTKSLKKWWQHFNIPPWQRHGWPLIYVDETLVMIPGLFIVEGWQAKENEHGWHVEYL